MWRIKAELFIKTVLGYLVILLALFSVSWICDKVINTIIILMSYGGTRWVFLLTYHAKTDKGCIMFTIACFSIAIVIALPINLSIVASVIVGMSISTFLFFLQYFLDLIAEQKAKEKEYLYKMTETELRQHGASKGLSEIQNDILVYRIIENLKISEICEYRNYGRTTIKYHIGEIKKKLNIKSL
jgi:MFS superfamily sulfate permease-like transporter